MHHFSVVVGGHNTRQIATDYYKLATCIADLCTKNLKIAVQDTSFSVASRTPLETKSAKKFEHDQKSKSKKHTVQTKIKPSLDILRAKRDLHLPRSVRCRQAV